MGNRGVVRAAAPVLVCLVLASCAGHPSTGPARPAPATTVTTTTPRVAVLTQVLTYQAFDDRGLLPGLVPADPVTGTCTGGSLKVAGRADAWRCSTGGRVLDPCFSAEGRTEVACVPDPFTRAVTMLELPGSFPRGSRNDPAQLPWFLELKGGARCGSSAGEPPGGPAATDRRPSYTCDDGSSVLGEPDQSRPVWRVQVDSAAGPSSVDVLIAWY